MLRRMLVETKPVRLAPEPAGFPNCGSSLDSGLSKFGSAPARGSLRRAGRRAGACSGGVVARVLESGAQTLRRTRCGLCQRMRRKHGENRAERQLKPSPNTPHEHVLTAAQGAAYG